MNLSNFSHTDVGGEKMLDIVVADLKSKAYKDFKDLLIAQWGQVDQLPEHGLEFTLPLPLLALQEKTLMGGAIFYRI